MNKEQLTLWKCEVAGPEGMFSPQLPTTFLFVSTSSRGFVPIPWAWAVGVVHSMSVQTFLLLCGIAAVHILGLGQSFPIFPYFRPLLSPF